MKRAFILITIIVFTGCAGFMTRDSTFKKRFTGDFKYEKNGVFIEANYSDGFIIGEAIFGKKSCCKWISNYVNGKKHGTQVFELTDGKKMISSTDSLKTKQKINLSVDENGTRWFVYKTIEKEGKKFEVVENNFYKTATIIQMKDTIENGPGYHLLNGDTVCYNKFEKGKKTIRDPDCHRTAKSILKTVKENIKNLKKVYNRHLVNGDFKAKLYIQFYIGPNGGVEGILVHRMFTQNVEFVENILNEVIEWKFDEIVLPYNDLVTIPFTFSL